VHQYTTLVIDSTKIVGVLIGRKPKIALRGDAKNHKIDSFELIFSY